MDENLLRNYLFVDDTTFVKASVADASTKLPAAAAIINNLNIVNDQLSPGAYEHNLLEEDGALKSVDKIIDAPGVYLQHKKQITHVANM